VQVVASVQAHVAVVVPPHVGGVPNEAVQRGRLTQVVLAATDPVPPGPVAVIEQFSPAAPTGSIALLLHDTGPLPGEVPVQVYAHAVASEQLHVTVALLPQLEGADHVAVQRGAATHDVLAVADPLPPAPVAVMVHASPAAPTSSGAEPTHATGPLLGVLPVQVYVHDVASEQLHVTVALLPHAARSDHEAVHRGVGAVEPQAPALHT
jgi:hypothetical protein